MVDFPSNDADFPQLCLITRGEVDEVLISIDVSKTEPARLKTPARCASVRSQLPGKADMGHSSSMATWNLEWKKKR